MPATITAAPGGFSPLVPPSGRFWLDAEAVSRRPGRKPPAFSTSVVAGVFFGRSAAWLRVKMRPHENSPSGNLVLDGKPLIIGRSDSDDRQFTLVDIERVAHALYQQGGITRDRLASALATVIACAVSHGILEAPWAMPKEPGEPAKDDDDHDE